MSFNIPSSAWFFFLIIPLVIFYFLKLRRNRVEIPSLLLWQQVLEDSRVNSPFQRFKKNLLLLLQLLILCLLILAAMDPFTIGSSTGAKVPILVDCSASMGAVNDRGESRLDLVKEKLTELINGKPGEQEFSIISYSNNARRVCSFSSNSQVLLDAVKHLKVDDVEGNFEDALRLTQAMTKSSQFGEVLLYSDGNISDVPTFNLSFKLNYQKIKEENLPNIGVSKMNAVRSGQSSWMVFIQIDMNEFFKGSAELQIYQNGDKIGTDKVFAGDKLSQRLSFRVDGSKESVIEARLVTDSFDSLKVDNSAFLSLKLARPLDVFIPESLDLISTIVKNIEGVKIVNDQSAHIDLLFTDKKEHLELPAKTAITFGFIPEDLEPFYETKSEQSKIIDWDKTDLILQHTSLDDVLLIKTLALKADSRPVEIEKKAYEIVSYGEKAPVILKKNYGNKNAYHFLFNYFASTLPYKIAFPIMITNTINKAMADAGLSEISGNQTGVLPEVYLDPSKEYSVTGPDNKTIKVTTSEKGVLDGVPALISGTYKISEGSKDIHNISVSLLSQSETSLEKLNNVKFNEMSVTVSEEEAQTDKSLWGLVTLIAFIFLVLEWWFYQKRPGSLSRSKA